MSRVFRAHPKGFCFGPWEWREDCESARALCLPRQTHIIFIPWCHQRPTTSLKFPLHRAVGDTRLELCQAQLKGLKPRVSGFRAKGLGFQDNQMLGDCVRLVDYMFQAARQHASTDGLVMQFCYWMSLLARFCRNYSSSYYCFKYRNNSL